MPLEESPLPRRGETFSLQDPSPSLCICHGEVLPLPISSCWVSYSRSRSFLFLSLLFLSPSTLISVRLDVPRVFHSRGLPVGSAAGPSAASRSVIDKMRRSFRGFLSLKGCGEVRLQQSRRDTRPGLLDRARDASQEGRIWCACRSHESRVAVTIVLFLLPLLLRAAAIFCHQSARTTRCSGSSYPPLLSIWRRRNAQQSAFRSAECHTTI